MGTGSYTGGHTKIFISDSGTTWEVSDRPAKERDDSRRDRWDAEIAVKTGPRITKESRSFLSMCAVAFRRDVLSDHNPKPPAVLQRQVTLAGGNKNWIVSDPTRLRLFEDFYRKTGSKR
jgi:hypothetical protein